MHDPTAADVHAMMAVSPTQSHQVDTDRRLALESQPRPFGVGIAAALLAGHELLPSARARRRARHGSA
jgi:hypothetical protein